MRARCLRLLIAGESVSDTVRMTGVGRTWLKTWCWKHDIRSLRGPNGGLTSESLVRARELLDTMSGVSSQGGAAADSSSWTNARGHLTACARGVIQGGILDDKTNAELARALGVDPSAVSREIARNGGRDAYVALAAHERAVVCRARPRPGKLEGPSPLRRAVITHLNCKFSPEQVAGYLKTAYPDDEDMQCSHETIYQALYVQGKSALRHELTVEKALRSGRTNRKPKSKLPERRGNKSWIGEATIQTRPPEVADRAVPGHWEGDLVIGKLGRSALITLVERYSRYALIRRLPLRHDAPTVTDALTEMVADLPAELRQTLTWDQGSEMADHARFTMATSTRVYFCDPHSPWQRGTNENTNGLIRDFYPKGTDFTTVTDDDIAEMQRLLNIRPRKTLGWKNPSDTLNSFIGSALTT